MPDVRRQIRVADVDPAVGDRHHDVVGALREVPRRPGVDVLADRPGDPVDRLAGVAQRPLLAEPGRWEASPRHDGFRSRISDVAAPLRPRTTASTSVPRGSLTTAGALAERRDHPGPDPTPDRSAVLRRRRAAEADHHLIRDALVGGARRGHHEDRHEAHQHPDPQPSARGHAPVTNATLIEPGERCERILKR